MVGVLEILGGVLFQVAAGAMFRSGPAFSRQGFESSPIYRRQERRGTLTMTPQRLDQQANTMRVLFALFAVLCGAALNWGGIVNL
jgi:hypothetical protein